MIRSAIPVRSTIEICAILEDAKRIGKFGIDGPPGRSTGCDMQLYIDSLRCVSGKAPRVNNSSEWEVQHKKDAAASKCVPETFSCHTHCHTV